MKNKNPNIGHRRSIRLKGYDYSQAGFYFITICCHDRVCLFGKIVGVENNESPKMVLNDAGKIANECWMEIPKHFPNSVLYEHIIMPNHIHGIIELKSEPVGANDYSPNKNVINDVNGANDYNRANDYSPLRSPSKTIGSIVRGFKIGVTKWFRNNTDYKTIWQRNYHEHIICNEQSYQTISQYIINNPAKWEDDKFYKQ